ncbi:MAG: adenosylcobinamide-phosphate synthase CbiB [Treponema sp.]|nr:adenosylcobinamide-phosphate synthase CbiB [Treponema sp.]
MSQLYGGASSAIFYLGPPAIVLSFLLDLVLVPPRWMPHPVRGIGFLITKGESVLRRLLPGRAWFAGTLLVILVGGFTLGLSTVVFVLAYRVNNWVGFVVQVFMSCQVLTLRSLQKESVGIYKKVRQDDLVGARKALSRIVGRDTVRLSMDQVIKATIETIAENLSGGVIAPLFFLALGGPPLGMLYKAITTMDSMIGYQNRRYLAFGRTAATLDDIVNWLPTRVAARFMLAAAGILNLNAANAARIYKRDKHQYAGPIRTEAVAAGALGIALGGDAWYFGELHQKPVLGDAIRSVRASDILAAIRLMYMSSVLFLPIASIISAILSVIIIVQQY